MRAIPSHITEQEKIQQLKDLSQQIEAKMKLVKTMKDTSQIHDLKKLGNEIDALDKEWKQIAGM